MKTVIMFCRKIIILTAIRRACIYFQRQEMTASSETLDGITDTAPQALSYHSNASTLRSTDSPKRDATEMYLKSKALLESRRECRQTSLALKGCSAFTFFHLHLETSYTRVIAYFYSTEPHTKDIDVFLKRDIETGFGFRVLGGEGPQQPVSNNILVGTFI